MADEEATHAEAPDGSDSLLRDERDNSAVAVGVLTIVDQLSELEGLLREFGRNCDDRTPIGYEAQKALFRCVDALKVFNNEHGR